MHRPRKRSWFVGCGVALLLAATGVSRADEAREPFVVAAKDTEIKPGEVAMLQRIVLRRGKHPWLIHLSKAWYATPPAQRCEVYLRPSVRKSRLCRGTLLQGLGVTDDRGQIRWELTSTPEAYAQVPLPGRSFGPGHPLPGALDGPFTVTGRISNRDLVQIADLVRTKESPMDQFTHSKPHKEIGTDGQEEEVLTVLSGHMPVDRSLPISFLEAKDADHVHVTTSAGNGSGGDITVQRKNGRWKITEVGMWNA